MLPLKLDLLGPARLTSPDGEILLTSPLPMALLAFLALEERPVSREHLAQLFWPGMDRSRRLHNLRQTILRLKRAHTQNLVVGDGMLRVRPMDPEGVELFFQNRRGADPLNLSRYPGSESIVGYFAPPEEIG